MGRSNDLVGSGNVILGARQLGRALLANLVFAHSFKAAEGVATGVLRSIVAFRSMGFELIRADDDSSGAISLDSVGAGVAREGPVAGGFILRHAKEYFRNERNFN